MCCEYELAHRCLCVFCVWVWSVSPAHKCQWQQTLCRFDSYHHNPHLVCRTHENFDEILQSLIIRYNISNKSLNTFIMVIIINRQREILCQFWRTKPIPAQSGIYGRKMQIHEQYEIFRQMNDSHLIPWKSPNTSHFITVSSDNELEYTVAILWSSFYIYIRL